MWPGVAYAPAGTPVPLCLFLPPVSSCCGHFPTARPGQQSPESSWVAGPPRGTQAHPASWQGSGRSAGLTTASCCGPSLVWLPSEARVFSSLTCGPSARIRYLLCAHRVPLRNLHFFSLPPSSCLSGSPIWCLLCAGPEPQHPILAGVLGVWEGKAPSWAKPRAVAGRTSLASHADPGRKEAQAPPPPPPLLTPWTGAPPPPTSRPWFAGPSTGPALPALRGHGRRD